MGLLAYCHELLSVDIQRTSKNFTIKIEHQEINPNDEPIVMESIIEVDPTSKKISLMKLSKVIEDAYELIKKSAIKNGLKKILRMTKLMLVIDGVIDWRFSIITSNRFDYDFLKFIKANKICWAINPLVKFYEDVKETLDSMKHYLQTRRSK